MSIRGADRVFLEICALWPDADIFTPVYDESGTEGRFANRRVHTSFLQRARPNARTFRALLPLYPAAIESFDLSGYDLVVSSSSAWAHAVICEESTVHVSYCHNPFRYAWNERQRTLSERGDPVVARRAAPPLQALARVGLDRRAASEPLHHELADDAGAHPRYFGRESGIVYPPVATERFVPGPVGDHYLVLSELVSHKRIDVAVEAFNGLRLPLVIAGDGPDRRRLRQLAGPTIHFAGRVGDQEVAQLLRARERSSSRPARSSASPRSRPRPLGGQCWPAPLAACLRTWWTALPAAGGTGARTSSPRPSPASTRAPWTRRLCRERAAVRFGGLSRSVSA